MLRIIYMGTPQFAVPPLEALIQGVAPGAVLPEGYEIVTVITRPDKPVGRGQEIIYSPVKQTALAHNIPVWQPGSLKKPENIEALALYSADLYLVCRLLLEKKKKNLKPNETLYNTLQTKMCTMGS